MGTGMGNHTDRSSVLPWRAVTIATPYIPYRHNEAMAIGEYDFAEKANLNAEMAVVSNQVSD